MSYIFLTNASDNSRPQWMWCSQRRAQSAEQSELQEQGQMALHVHQQMQATRKSNHIIQAMHRGKVFITMCWRHYLQENRIISSVPQGWSLSLLTSQAVGAVNFWVEEWQLEKEVNFCSLKRKLASGFQWHPKTLTEYLQITFNSHDYEVAISDNSDITNMYVS